MRFRKCPSPGPSAGFSLVEVVLALGITSFAILTILGLLGTALQSNRDSEQRLEAANLATLILSQYQNALAMDSTTGAWVSPLPETVSATSAPSQDSAPVGLTLDGQSTSNLRDRDAKYGLTYRVWKSPRLGAGANYDLIHCALKLRWPAAALAADSTNPDSTSYEVVTSFLVHK